MKIKENILNILDECTIQNNIVFLPNRQLDRKIYQEVNKCLEAIGGKWNRKAKGHVFNEDPTELFDSLLINGEFTDYKKEYQYFPTPKSIAQYMISIAEIELGHIILEPSAGQGAIADEFPKENRCVLVELNKDNADILKNKGYDVINTDFLKYSADNIDRVIMNPPFSRQQDIDHVLHAFNCLNNGGILVSVVSEGVFFRTNKKTLEFRKFLEEYNAEVIENEENAFKESGTMVKTRIIKIRK